MSSVYGYADYTDLDNEIVRLADLVPSGKNAQIWVEGFISAAEREVNGRISTKYATPFTSPIPDIVKCLTVEIAAFRILRQAFVREDPSQNDWVDDYRKQANLIIKDILDDKIKLNPGDTGTESDVAISTTSGNGREFTLTKRDSSGNILSLGTMEDTALSYDNDD